MHETGWTPPRVQVRVRVQVPTLFVDPVLDWLGSLLTTHDGLQVDLLVGDTAEDMLTMGLDLVLTAVPPTNAGVLLKRLGSASPQLAADPSYLARRGTPTRPADLVDHETLRFHAERSLTRWSLQHDDGTVARVEVGGRLTSNDSRTLLRALRAGLGIGPLPAGDWEQLVPVLPAWRMTGIDMFLAVAPGRRRVPRVRAVLEGLEVIGRSVLVQPSSSSGSPSKPC